MHAKVHVSAKPCVCMFCHYYWSIVISARVVVNNKKKLFVTIKSVNPLRLQQEHIHSGDSIGSPTPVSPTIVLPINGPDVLFCLVTCAKPPLAGYTIYYLL